MFAIRVAVRGRNSGTASGRSDERYDGAVGTVTFAVPGRHLEIVLLVRREVGDPG